MTLVRWDPFRDLLNLHGQLARDDYGSWAPAVDIFQRGNDLVIRAEMPGVDRDDIDVRVEDGTLILGGERRRSSEIKEENVYRLERSYGKFSRSFRLPTTVDAAKVAADYKDGVLEIRLPTAEEARPRQIKINAA